MIVKINKTSKFDVGKLTKFIRKHLDLQEDFDDASLVWKKKNMYKYPNNWNGLIEIMAKDIVKFLEELKAERDKL